MVYKPAAGRVPVTTVRFILTPAVSAPEDRAHSPRIEVVAVYARTTHVSMLLSDFLKNRK